MVRRHRVRQLALVPLRLVRERIRDVRRDERAVALLRLEPAGSEEPQLVLHDRPADREGVLRHRFRQTGVHVIRIVGDRRRFKRRQRAPVVVVEHFTERAREHVAARLGDDVHDAAAKPAELRRHAARRDRRLLDRVFDVQVVWCSTDVFGDGHAVHHEQVFKRRPAGNRVRAARARRVDAGRLQQARVDVAVGRQRRDQVLLEVGRDLRGLRQHVGRPADDVDGLADRGRTERRVDRQRLSRRQRRRLRDGLEAAQLERQGVRARRQ